MKTKGEFKKLVKGLAVAGIIGFSALSPLGSLGTSFIEPVRVEASELKSFTDIPTPNSHWGYKDIMTLVGKGGIDGYQDGSFLPNKPITRAEFLKIALQSSTGKSYPKAENDIHWAQRVLRAANELGIVTSSEWADTSLDKEITRNEMARILIRLDNKVLGNTDVSTTGVENYITDYKQLDSNYKVYIEQAVSKGLLEGDASGKYNGTKTGTRAEASAMIVRLLDENARKDIDVSKPNPNKPAEVPLTNEFNQMNFEHLKKYEVAALNTARTYQQNGNVYLEMTLPTLEGGYVWTPSVHVVTKDGTNLYSSDARMCKGSTGKITFNLTKGHDNLSYDGVMDNLGGCSPADVKAGAVLQVTFKITKSDSTGSHTGAIEYNSSTPNGMIQRTYNSGGGTLTAVVIPTAEFSTAGLQAGWK